MSKKKRKQSKRILAATIQMEDGRVYHKKQWDKLWYEIPDIKKVQPGCYNDNRVLPEVVADIIRNEHA